MSLQEPDLNYRFPLHLACSYNRIKAVKYLVEIVQVEINVLDMFNNTPLDDAINNGCEDIV